MNIAPRIISTKQIFAKYVLIMTENILSNIVQSIIDYKTDFIFDFHVPTCLESPIMGSCVFQCDFPHQWITQ